MIEVGLGGVRDATNVLPAAGLATAVIAAVGHDHAAALGGGIEQIAAAKAGIMQAGRPVVVARQPEAAAERVLLQRGKLGGLEISLLLSACLYWQAAAATGSCTVLLLPQRFGVCTGDTIRPEVLLPACYAAHELGCPVIQASQEVQFLPASEAASGSGSGSGSGTSGVQPQLRQRRRMALSGQTAAALLGPGEPAVFGELHSLLCDASVPASS